MSFPKAPEWIEALEAAATEVVAQGGGELPEFEPSPAQVDGQGGAFISLVGPGLSVRLGVVGSPEVLKRLAGFASMCGPEEVELQDGACELANILAGNVRKLLNSRAPDLQLGLPMYSSRQPPADRFQVASTALKLPESNLEAQLWVMLPKPTA